MTDFVKQGKRNRINGADFEKRVRKDLEEKGWIVSKWQNNVEIIQEPYTMSIGIPQEFSKSMNAKIKGYGKCIPAKASRFRLSSTGFPDFIAYKNINLKDFILEEDYNLKVEFKGEKYCSFGKWLEKLIDIAWNTKLDSLGFNEPITNKFCQIIFIECKINGYLDKTEKEKAKWYLDNNYCSKFLIASKTKVKNRIVIEYKEFKNI